MYPAMKVRESVGRLAKPAMRPKKFATQINTRDLVKLNKHWRVIQWVKSLGETPMTVFHTCHCRCKGVNRDSGYRLEESHLMHDT